MNTRSLSPVLFALLLTMSAGASAATEPARRPSPTFDLTGGRHLRIVSAYLRDGPGAVVVRGFVRRDPLWRGPVDGHLHITAYAPSGEVIARRATAWRGRFADSHGPPLAYQTDLGVQRADVARVAVAFAPGRHTASETFQ